MEKNKKIIVLKAREFIYTLIFAALILLLVFVLVWMFSAKDHAVSTNADVYRPGIYTSSVSLGNSALHVDVTVDSDRVTHVDFVNTDEAVTTMYPLLDTTLDEINAQLTTAASPEDLTFSGENQYTTTIIKQAILAAVEKAKINP